MEQNEVILTEELQKNRKQQAAKAKRRIVGFYLLCGVTVLLIAALIAFAFSAFHQDAAPTDAAAVPTTTAAAVPTGTPRPAPEIPPASEQNDLLKIATSAQGAPDKKICYLTFDDGPTNEVTPAILEVLSRYNVKATFFMLGKMIEANPEMAKRVYDEGHLLANHSYSHSYSSLYSSGESFMEEIHKTEDLITNLTGVEPFKLMRFPGGGHNAGEYGSAKQQYKLLLQQDGYYFADWNCLNGDAEGGSRSAEQLIARTKETCLANNVVILMHDAATKKTTADSLPSVIEYLQGAGYEFRCMDEIPYYGGENEKPMPDMAL